MSISYKEQRKNKQLDEWFEEQKEKEEHKKENT